MGLRLRHTGLEYLDHKPVRKVKVTDTDEGLVVTVAVLDGPAGPYEPGDEIDVYPYQLEETQDEL